MLAHVVTLKKRAAVEAAVAAETAPAEPEVIKKGKKDEDGEGEVRRGALLEAEKKGKEK